MSKTIFNHFPSPNQAEIFEYLRIFGGSSILPHPKPTLPHVRPTFDTCHPRTHFYSYWKKPNQSINQSKNQSGIKKKMYRV